MSIHLFQRCSLGFEDYMQPEEHMVQVNETDTSETPEAIEVTVTHAVDIVEEGFARVEEIQQTEDSLESIAMVLADQMSQGMKLSPAAAMVLHNSIDSLESRLGYRLYIPSVEDFTSAKGLLQTEISFENLLQAWSAYKNAIYEAMDIIVRGAIALTRVLTPLINKKINRVEALMKQVNNSNREAGLKEVTGNFVPALTIAGKIPEPKTLIKCLENTFEMGQEILSARTSNEVASYVEMKTRDFLRGMSSDDFGKPSKWWFAYFALAVIIAPAPIVIVGTKMMMAHGGMQANEMFKRVNVPKDFQINLNEVFPKVVKTREDSKDVRVHTFKSEPMLGGRVIRLRTLNYDAGTRGLDSLREMTGLNKNDIGLSIEKDSPTGIGEIRTLTSAEQKVVLNATMNLLQMARDYHKSETDRIGSRVRMNKGVFDELNRLYTDKSILNPNSNAALMSMRMVMKHYTNIYWNGVVRCQLEFTRYISEISSALLQYVERSMNATQAEKYR